MIDRRPGNGSGSCARCEGSLDLASVRERGIWYCSTACAEGRVRAEPDPPAVPEPWLYHRPRRYFRARPPRELKAGGAP